MAEGKVESYIESALSSLKSKFAELKEQLDHLSSIIMGAQTQEQKDNGSMRKEEDVSPSQDQENNPLFHKGCVFPWGHVSNLDRRLIDLGRQLASWNGDYNDLASRLNTPGLIHQDFLNPSFESKEKEGKYILSVPLGKNLSPDEVKIKVKENVMIIEGKKEQKSEDGSSRSYQEFMRKFTLPETVKKDEIKSVLTPEGYLHIDAPLLQDALLEPPKPKEIPIEFL